MTPLQYATAVRPRVRADCTGPELGQNARNRRSAGVLPAVSVCAPVGIRTPNLLIRSQMLYPLSYGRLSRTATAAQDPMRIAERMRIAEISRDGVGTRPPEEGWSGVLEHGTAPGRSPFGPRVWGASHTLDRSNMRARASGLNLRTPNIVTATKPGDHTTTPRLIRRYARRPPVALGTGANAREGTLA